MELVRIITIGLLAVSCSHSCGEFEQGFLALYFALCTKLYPKASVSL